MPMLKITFLISLFITIFDNSDCAVTKNLNAAPGRRVLVNLFQWKWTDIALECERFLGPKGFAGVQVSPPNEHAVINNPYRPWWERYQPVSYKLDSRSGNEQQFIDMVQRCNAVGVRVYVDVIINRMSGGNGVGSAGSSYNSYERIFPGLYLPNDFSNEKCGRGMKKNIFGKCKGSGLPNLNLNSYDLRNKISEFLNKLIDIGVAGFCIDSVRYMHPADIQNIIKELKDLNEEIFGTRRRPFILSDISDLGKHDIKSIEYTSLGRVTDYKFAYLLSEIVMKKNGQKLINIKEYFKNSFNHLPNNDAFVFIDKHENQRRSDGLKILTFLEPREYKIANALMLAWPYGSTQVMSSFAFNKTDYNQGPPSYENGTIKDVFVKEDGTCGNGWICEHRWRQITNMITFRNVAGNSGIVHWQDNRSNQIAFGRANRAINNDHWKMEANYYTALPAGTYCDIISGEKKGNICTGRKLFVNDDGMAEISIGYYKEDPIIAIHVESKL